MSKTLRTILIVMGVLVVLGLAAHLARSNGLFDLPAIFRRLHGA
jgi:hypothetical protein